MSKTTLRNLILISTMVILVSCTPSSGNLNIDELIQDYTVSSAKELYPEALRLAQQWNSKAVLEHVILDVQRADDYDQLMTSYSFRIQEDTKQFLNIYFNVSTTFTEITKETGELGNERPLAPPVIPTELTLDSQDILIIVLENGGGEFIQTHRYQSLSLDLILENRQTDEQFQLVWRGSFGDLTTRESIDIQVDPNTGDVLEIKRFLEN